MVRVSITVTSLLAHFDVGDSPTFAPTLTRIKPRVKLRVQLRVLIELRVCVSMGFRVM